MSRYATTWFYRPFEKYNLKSQVMHHGFIEFLKNGAFEPGKKKIN